MEKTSVLKPLKMVLYQVFSDNIQCQSSASTSSEPVPSVYRIEEVLTTKCVSIRDFFLERTKQDILETVNMQVLFESTLEAEGPRKIHTYPY